MIDEGYIKFQIKHVPGPPPVHPALPELYRLRELLYKQGLIGAYHNGIGYGNISARIGKGSGFIISASATGNKDGLAYDDFSEVISFDVDKNAVFCSGPLRASSESMTHGAIYQARPDTNCVIHVHNIEIYNYMLRNGLSATSASAKFGTPEMANEIGALAAAGERSGVIVMTGHEEGVVAYSDKAQDAYNKIAALFDIVVR